ncbi:MAG: TIGR03905 family TSCPD domain-containing protein, partial [Clostridia bacterium]|nr:TIGR03905 family TSCPD domain-containing protein [Clostridia bacterium]
YTPRGICARQITVSAENGIITDAEIIGGCDGNHKGIISLIKGMKVVDAIERMQGIRCGSKETSCPDQLAKALQKLLDTEENLTI